MVVGGSRDLAQRIAVPEPTRQPTSRSDYTLNCEEPPNSCAFATAYDPLMTLQPATPTLTPTAAPPRTNVLAIVAIVAGFMAPIAGIVTGRLALLQIKRTGEEGRALALTGLIAGYTLTAFTAIFMVVWFVMFFGIMSGAFVAQG